MDNEYSLVLKEDDKWVAIQTENTLPIESINAQLLVLQTAFPAIVRNYDQYEFQALQQLWYDIFKNVPEQLMREAIRRYIINDRKGFFPSPGQIIGCIKQIVLEQEETARMREYYQRLRKRRECENVTNHTGG